MQLDITSVLATSGSRLRVCGKLTFESVIFCGTHYGFAEDIDINGTIVNQGGILELVAAVSGQAIVDCARCGKPTAVDFSYELNEKLIKQGSSCTDEDATLFDGSVINIDEIALNGFLMNASGKYLCKEDCKGICPKCGANLNEKDCGCSSDSVDPRFDILNNIKF